MPDVSCLLYRLKTIGALVKSETGKISKSTKQNTKGTKHRFLKLLFVLFVSFLCLLCSVPVPLGKWERVKWVEYHRESHEDEA
jgi:hypothetical protein